MVLGQDGLLCGVHTAETGAVGTPDGFITGAYTLDEDHVLGFLAIGRTFDVSLGGAGSGEHALVLQGGDYVGVLTSAVFAVYSPVYESKPVAAITAPTSSTTNSST